ncbi:MAG: RecQ family ATP-dependent DNA helicase [Bacteroides sp.]|nr:RecQ family ATP-dependent DNA helicase [Prevotella sp.]MCM1408894.1 RecQ family ATP-dependent DNA helicase [Treponema brennaborense]MCM1470845.1 RecQ family ATP-dependent DNA helicase [Bacteroides sp.]
MIQSDSAENNRCAVVFGSENRKNPRPLYYYCYMDDKTCTQEAVRCGEKNAADSRVFPLTLDGSSCADAENAALHEEPADSLCVPLDSVERTARDTFGVHYLYPWQRFVIANILDAASEANAAEKTLSSCEEDSAERGRQIVLLPTGAGKSLCFLVPAVMLPRATLIVYPLLALMSDQERRIRASGLECVVFQGGQPPNVREENFSRLKTGVKIILANPEVLRDKQLTARIASLGISQIAIDEAHCVSEWGDTFRPAYLELGRIICRLNARSVTAFTATASDSVLQRISQILFGGKAHVIRGDTDRQNIFYQVKRADAKQQAVIEILRTARRPAVVFCGTRKRAEDTARLLRNYFADTAAAAGKNSADERECIRFYHAGLSKEEKTAAEKWFFPKQDAVLVSTCAFGMGVDKPDIRTVIHLDAPATPEFFAQESGRAARDGGSGLSILIWSSADSRAFAAHESGSRKRAMLDFAEKGSCRREILVHALGGTLEYCAGCDVCGGSAQWDAADKKQTVRFIKKRRYLLRQQEAAAFLHNTANNYEIRHGRIRGWEINDFAEIIDAAIASGAIQKKRVFASGSNTLLRAVSEKLLHLRLRCGKPKKISATTHPPHDAP